MINHFIHCKSKILIFEVLQKLESQEVGRASPHAHQPTQHPHKTQQKIHADSVHTIQKLHNCFPRAVYYCATFFHFQESSLRLALPIVMHRRELSPLLDEFNVCLSTGCLSRVCGVCACIFTRLSVSWTLIHVRWHFHVPQAMGLAGVRNSKLFRSPAARNL